PRQPDDACGLGSRQARARPAGPRLRHFRAGQRRALSGAGLERFRGDRAPRRRRKLRGDDRIADRARPRAHARALRRAVAGRHGCGNARGTVRRARAPLMPTHSRAARRKAQSAVAEDLPMRFRAAVVALLSVVLLASCASMSMKKIQTKETILEDTLKMYAATMRWGDMTQGLGFVDPKYLQVHPMTDLELARYKQVRVTSYDDQPAAPV